MLITMLKTQVTNYKKIIAKILDFSISHRHNQPSAYLQTFLPKVVTPDINPILPLYQQPKPEKLSIDKHIAKMLITL